MAGFAMKAKQIISLTVAAMASAVLLSACVDDPAPDAPPSREHPVYRTLESIPGVTDYERGEIERLRQRRSSFVYGMNRSTETFTNVDGELRGFTVLFCRWLSDLFGIPFVPAIYEWGELSEGLSSGAIDFTGELALTAERRRTHLMTDAIAGRSVGYMRIAGHEPLSHISTMRLPNCAFLDGATTYGDVRAFLGDSVRYIFVETYAEAYRLLSSGEADAFFADSTAIAAFDFYGDVIVEDFYPFIYCPVSLSTQNPDNAAIISVVQKALQNDGMFYLTELYSLSLNEYRRHKLDISLTAEESAFIKNNPVVNFAAEYDNYPVSFFNRRENEWQGVCFDVLREVESLTGLKFELIADEQLEWPVLQRMLETGEASVISELIRTPDREGGFLWPDTPLLTDYYALLSKSELGNIGVNEVWLYRVGLVIGTAPAELFDRWYPSHSGTKGYTSYEQAFNALQRGDVDMVMASRNQLLVLTHYEELAGYKTNLVFNYPLASTLGFHKGEETLRGIVEKALRLIDIDSIDDYWTTRTFDYRERLSEAQLPWFGGVVALVVALGVVLFALVALVYTKRKSERLAADAELRGQALIADNEMLDRLNRMKNEFFQNMSHDFKTPLTVISTSVLNAKDMLDYELDKDEMRESLDNAQREVMRMARMVESAMKYSSLHDNRQDMVPVDIAQLLHEGAETYRALLERHGNSLSYDIPPTLPNVYGNADMLLHVMSNLLSNANRHTRNGDVSIVARCVVGKKRPDILVSVADNGEGVKPDILSSVFERGVSESGTGLGLSICLTALEAHDGAIGIESEPGKGTTVWFTIPIIERRERLGIVSPGMERRRA